MNQFVYKKIRFILWRHLFSLNVFINFMYDYELWFILTSNYHSLFFIKLEDKFAQLFYPNTPNLLKLSLYILCLFFVFPTIIRLRLINWLSWDWMIFISINIYPYNKIRFLDTFMINQYSNSYPMNDIILKKFLKYIQYPTYWNAL